MHVACRKCGSLPQSFCTTLQKQPTNRDSIDKQLTQLNQLPIRPDMDNLPTDKDINLAIRKLKNSAEGVYGIRSEIYKALATNPETFYTIRKNHPRLLDGRETAGGI